MLCHFCKYVHNNESTIIDDRLANKGNFFNEILITNAKCFCQNKSSNLNHDSCDTFFPKRCYLPVETH